MRMGKAKWPSMVGWWAWSYFSDMRSYFPNVRVLIMWSREKPNGPGCWVDEGDHIFRIFRYHLVSPLDTIYSPTSRDSNTYPRKISTPNLCGIFSLTSKFDLFYWQKRKSRLAKFYISCCLNISFVTSCVNLFDVVGIIMLERSFEENVEYCKYGNVEKWVIVSEAELQKYSSVVW